ncbi:XAP5, circadian clock regulator-domain-containing protein [Coemansia spiralis]|nr:XAP5, circadian clock regulator-domain-containing protein [Coemansia spiralis]
MAAGQYNDDKRGKNTEYLKQQRERIQKDTENRRNKTPVETRTNAETIEDGRPNERSPSDSSVNTPRSNEQSKGSQRFVSKEESVENKLKMSTIGLVKLEEFQRIKGELEEERLREAAKTLVRKRSDERKKAKSMRKQKGALSFDNGDDDSDDAMATKKTRKNPNVDTSFLPDKEREEEEARMREELRQKWLKEQEMVKKEPITITYSYWDGSGHRKQVKCFKGDTIAQFLEKCRAQVPELRGAKADSLVYIKEDLIIPHHYTFYDFIINKARGKSGPLFNFDVHDDVRLTHDARVEKDDSHAGKVCERTWYERNKHIFPANRWETFDPEKNYGSYTIKDSRKKKSK